MKIEVNIHYHLTELFGNYIVVEYIVYSEHVGPLNQDGQRTT